MTEQLLQRRGLEPHPAVQTDSAASALTPAGAAALAWRLSPLPTFLVDGHGLILNANAAAVRLIACPTAQAAAGSPLASHFHPLDRSTFFSLLRSPAVQVGPCALRWTWGGSLGTETVHVQAGPAPDGQLFCVHVLRSPARAAATEPPSDGPAGRWRTALEAAGDGVWDWNPQTGEIFFSERLKALLGYTSEEMPNSTAAWAELVHPDDLQACRDAMCEHVQGLRPHYESEYRMRAKNGSYRWILSRGTVVMQDSEGQPCRIAGTHTDTTERKSMEIRLLAAQEALADTVNAIPDLVFEMSLDGHYIQCLTTHSAFLLQPAERYAGQHVSQVLPPAAAQQRLLALQEAQQRGISRGRRYSVHLDGHLHWFECSVVRKAMHPDGAPRFLVVTRDVTQHKRLEDELRIAAKAFESQHPMMLLDRQFHVLRVNPAACELMGQDVLARIGESVTTIEAFSQVPETAIQQIGAEVQASGVASSELSFQRGDGAVRSIWFTLNAVNDDNGEPSHYVATAIDITERRKRRQEIDAHAQAQRDALVREVHHRIKNILQGIVGILRDFARRHPHAAQPLSQVAGQVQSIAVIHGLQGQTQREQVYLCEMTQAIAQHVEALWQTPVQVDIPVPWEPCQIPTSEAVPVALILHELMLNAVKHSSCREQAVTVTLRKHGAPDEVRISIVNPGQWPPAEGAPSRQVGLQLVNTLMPRKGAKLSRAATQGRVETLLDLASPVLSVAPLSTEV